MTLTDPFQRNINYLRVSVTDRCDFRCTYCMSENMTFLPKTELLSLDELDRLCTLFIKNGITKLRITGGEPLVRRGIMGFFTTISRHLETGDLHELTLTTNGSQLTKYAGALATLGVRRVNISLDTLRPDRFKAITRWGRLAQVLDGIESARAAGLAVKINMVALKGINEDELENMVVWAGEIGADLTFIEVMPMGDMSDRLGQFWSLADLRSRLEKTWDLRESAHATGGPARYFRLGDTDQRLGFITPLSHNFCESCNRVRLNCTGTLYPCLGQENATDLRTVVRSGTDEAVVTAIRSAIADKPKGHDFDYSRQRVGGQMSRHMSHTGG